METVVGKEVVESEELEVGTLNVEESFFGGVDQEMGHGRIITVETNCQSIWCL